MKKILVVTALCALALSGMVLAEDFNLAPWSTPTPGSTSPLNIARTAVGFSNLVAINLDGGGTSSAAMTYQSPSFTTTDPQILSAAVRVVFNGANPSRAIWTNHPEAAEIGMFLRIINSIDRVVAVQDFRFTPGRMPGEDLPASTRPASLGERGFNVRTEGPMSPGNYHVEVTFYARAKAMSTVAGLMAVSPTLGGLHASSPR